MNTKFQPLLFCLTLSCSAFLVFFVQPMIGKMMLPHIGGSPSGWIVAMFFFQTSLLIGYFLAHIFTKAPPKINAILVLLCLLAGIAFLPLSFVAPDTNTVTGQLVFKQLMLSVGIPFIALSTLTPTLQKFFSYGNHKTSEDPYYMYAASNIGSFVGLFSYPLVIEIFFDLDKQSYFWSILYFAVIVLVTCCILTILMLKKPKKAAPQKAKTQEKLSSNITFKKRLHWLLLAAVPSSLMLGTTLELTTDIAPAPMVWVIPLGLYLITTIIAFSNKKPLISNSILSTLHLLGVMMIVAISVIGFTNIGKFSFTGALVIAVIYIAVFFVTALLLHRRLAANRPSKEHLTDFYLMMSLGGAIGGGFNAFVAPFLFSDVHEFYLVLILSLLLNPEIKAPTLKSLSKVTTFVSLLVITLYTLHVFKIELLENIVVFKAIGLIVNASLLFLILSPKKLFLTLLAILAINLTMYEHELIVDQHRNFFGVITVKDQDIPTDAAEVKGQYRSLFHGTTTHGLQKIGDEYKGQVYGYYSEESPIGDVLKNTNEYKNIGVVGLGTGQMACYKVPGREYTYYEIDQAVVDMAHEYFTYDEDCPIKENIIGDARLNLEKTAKNYDILVIDAFSSDSIPVHLLTSEALDIYMKNIKDDGALVLHISNRFIDLTKPLAALAKEEDAYFLKRFHKPDESEKLNFTSVWGAITKNEAIKNKLESQGWEQYETTEAPWTDNFSNILKFFHIIQKKFYNPPIKSNNPKESTEKTDA